MLLASSPNHIQAQLPGFVLGRRMVCGAVNGSVMELVTPLSVWRLGGLVERALSASEVVVAMLLALWAWRGCSCIRSGSAGRVELSRVG